MEEGIDSENSIVQHQKKSSFIKIMCNSPVDDFTNDYIEENTSKDYAEIKNLYEAIPKKLTVLRLDLYQSEENLIELENLLREKLSKDPAKGRDAILSTQLIASLLRDKRAIHSEIKSNAQYLKIQVSEDQQEIVAYLNNIENSIIDEFDKLSMIWDKLMLNINLLNDSNTLIYQLKECIDDLQENESIHQLDRKVLNLLSKQLSNILKLTQFEHSLHKSGYSPIKEEKLERKISKEDKVNNRLSASTRDEISLQKTDSNANTSFYISVEKPVLLSNHIYLDALQKKIEEIKELKQALYDITKVATNERIATEVNKLMMNKEVIAYTNSYIKKGVESILTEIRKYKKYDPEELAKNLEIEKQKNIEILQRFKKEMIQRRLIHSKLEDLKGTIRVYCRVRPLLEYESIHLQLQNEPYITCPDYNSVRIYNYSNNKESIFELDKVFYGRDNQIQIFEEIKPLITCVMDGYNSCILAYGQTGAGKTYTMEGKGETLGMIQHSLETIFEIINERKDDYEYNVNISILEIYNEQIRDLLRSKQEKNRLDIKENANSLIIYPELISPEIDSITKALEIINKGRANRKVESTNLNQESSRSHCIVMIRIIGQNKITGNKYVGYLNLIDLAGSERIYKSGSIGERMTEACNINQRFGYFCKSLAVLGKVLNEIASKNQHISYRESKLTHLLKESLGGNSKVLMIIQISPDPKDYSESVSTLQFGSRVNKIQKSKLKQNVLDFNTSKPTEFDISPKNFFSKPNSRSGSQDFIKMFPISPIHKENGFERDFISKNEKPIINNIKIKLENTRNSGSDKFNLLENFSSKKKN